MLNNNTVFDSTPFVKINLSAGHRPKSKNLKHKTFIRKLKKYSKYSYYKGQRAKIKNKKKPKFKFSSKDTLTKLIGKRKTGTEHPQNI